MQRYLYPVDKSSCGLLTKSSNCDEEKQVLVASWEAMSPYVMAEFIANLAMDRTVPSTVTWKNNQRQLKVDTTIAMTEEKSIPEPPVGIQKLSDIKSNSSCSSSKHFLFECDINEADYGESNPRRSKRNHSMTMSTEEESHLLPFDTSFLIRHNPHEMTAKLASSEITCLVRQIESHKQYKACLPCYKRFRNHVFERSMNINSLTNKQDKSILFNKLYSDSIQQLKALMKHLEALTREEQETGVHMTLPKLNTKGRTTAQNHDDSSDDITIGTREYDKKLFTVYMNDWLKRNWTNPYPDDEGLSKMAAENGTTETIISNWLINARTRKWRPSIVKAFELGHPADMLLEDSIRIFDGENLS